MRDKLRAEECEAGVFFVTTATSRKVSGFVGPRIGLLRDKFLIGMLLLAIGSACNAGGQAAGDDSTVRKFFALREQTLDQRGAPAQVEQIIALFKTGGHYEHPAASITMSLDEARSGMRAHLKEGRDAKITIHKIHHGANLIVAETTLRYSVADASGELKKIERNGVAIFELEGGKIVRIAEY